MLEDTIAPGPLLTALQGLSEIDQEILVLSYVQGFNSTEIGEMLGLNPGTVRKRKERVLERLGESESLLHEQQSHNSELTALFDDAKQYPVKDVTILS